jgi:rare lipoprotein A (peptidoglycan hydrolase)
VPSINIHANKGGYAADTGLDILGREGSDVVATLPGRIVYAEKGHSAQAGQSSSSRGYSDQHSVLVELDRPFTFKGKQIRFVWYSHLQGLDPAIAGKNGMRINAGQRLGAMGIANGVSHLHQGFLGNREQTVYLNAQEIKELYRQGIPGGSGPRASQGGGLTGVATFYSGSGGQDGVAGGKTANGERYNPNAMTAAIQWSLRGKYLNKWVTVEDQQTGKRVKVWVNDVGPMGGTNQAPNPRDPRIIDLSPAAFTKLFGGTSRGTGRIRIVGADGGGGPTRLGDRADAAPAGTSDGQQTASSKPSIGDQFIAQIEGEKGWEDNAGLQPLPLQRMYRQAGRPMTRGAIPLDERNNIIGGQTPKMRRQRSRETLPERSRQTIERIQKLNDIKLNWDPLEAELKQRFNNINPNPRSRLAAPSQEAFTKIMEPMIRKLRHVLAVANINLPGGEGIQIDRDVSELVSDKMASEIKGQLFRYLDAIWEGEYRKENGVKRRYGLPDREIADKLDKWDLPFVMRDNGGLGKMGNDILYEWNHRNQAKLRERTVDMIGITRDAVRPVEPFSPLLDHYSNPNEP